MSFKSSLSFKKLQKSFVKRQHDIHPCTSISINSTFLESECHNPSFQRRLLSMTIFFKVTPDASSSQLLHKPTPVCFYYRAPPNSKDSLYTRKKLNLNNFSKGLSTFPLKKLLLQASLIFCQITLEISRCHSYFSREHYILRLRFHIFSRVRTNLTLVSWQEEVKWLILGGRR